MSHSLPSPESESSPIQRRNPWAIVDLIVFGLFFVILLVATALVATPLSQLPVSFAILLQGVFNIALVGFIAAWIKIARRSSFTEYINFVRPRTLSTRSLIILGCSSAITVLILSAFLPSTGQTPLEKLLNSTSAIVIFAIFGVAVAPLLEEIIFRGFLFKAFWEIGGTVVAIFLNSVLFAVLHAGQLAGNFGGVVLIFLVACLLSFVRYRSNSIIPSFIVHTSYNATLFLLFAISTVLQKVH